MYKCMTKLGACQKNRRANWKEFSVAKDMGLEYYYGY